jgi:hypothetical protein
LASRTKATSPLHRFGDAHHDDDLKDHLRLKVFILAESFGLDDLDTCKERH